MSALKPSSNASPGVKLLNLAVHELRTPASVVSGYLRMLLAGHAGPLNERQQKLVTEAERSSRRLNDLVADLSTLANLEAGTLSLPAQRVALFALIRDVAAETREGRDRGVVIEVRTPADEAEVMADSVRLRAAVATLLMAMARERAMPGTLVIDGRVESHAGAAHVIVRLGEEAALPRLDGPAGRFDIWRGGLGVALPLARHVVEAAGGRLWSPRGRANRSATGLALPLAPPAP
jgi:K+-sensing histidine kinase KdpD